MKSAFYHHACLILGAKREGLILRYKINMVEYSILRFLAVYNDTKCRSMT